MSGSFCRFRCGHVAGNLLKYMNVCNADLYEGSILFGVNFKIGKSV